MKGSARFSPCGTYRYQLHRHELRPALLPPPKHVTFVMLNPSTADAEVEDPTVRRCLGFAVREGASSMTVVNLFALRSTDPAQLLRHPAPVGPDNDAAIIAACQGADLVVLAWGAHHAAVGRAPAVLELLAGEPACGPLRCLGTTKDGHPSHPLYAPGAAPLKWWRGSP